MSEEEKEAKKAERILKQKERNRKRIEASKRKIPASNIVSADEEKKLIRRTKIIIYTILIIFIIAGLTAYIDSSRTAAKKRPIFAISFNKNTENKTIEYYGLGYKVIDFNTLEGEDDFKFGSWFMRKEEFNSESREYSKRKEVNVYKLQILEDLDGITKKVKDIPKNADKIINENKDKFNQIKERENSYQHVLELLLHSETASQFDKYILAKIINEKNEKIDFKFKDARDFLKQYEEYLRKENEDKKYQENLDRHEDDLDQIAYDIIFGNPDIN